MTTNKRLFLFIILFISHLKCFGQFSSLSNNPPIDTLLQLLKTDKEDTTKVLHLVFLSKGFNNKNTDSSMLMANEALILSQDLKWKRGIAYAHTCIGWCYFVRGNYGKALENHQIALNIGKKENDNKIISIVLSYMGQVYYAEGEVQKALDFSSKALTLEEEFKDEWGIARNIGIIGDCYYELKEYDKALENYSKAYDLTEKIENKNGSGIWLGAMGDVYKDQGNYKKALSCYNKSSTIFKELKNEWAYASDLCCMGEVYLKLKKYSESYEYLMGALKHTEKTGALRSRQSIFLILSNLYQESTVPLPDSIGGKVTSSEKMRLIALEYYKKHSAIQDSLFNKESQKKS